MIALQASTVSPASRIATVRRLLDTHKPARVGGPREAIGTAVRGEVVQAIADSFLLYQKMTIQDQWLTNNPENLMHRLRENAYLANLEDYQALEDIIGEAHTRLGVDDEAARSWQAGTPEEFEAWRANWVAVTFGEVA